MDTCELAAEGLLGCCAMPNVSSVGRRKVDDFGDMLGVGEMASPSGELDDREVDAGELNRCLRLGRRGSGRDMMSYTDDDVRICRRSFLPFTLGSRQAPCSCLCLWQGIQCQKTMEVIDMDTNVASGMLGRDRRLRTITRRSITPRAHQTADAC